jgi:hypothetical protein
MEQEQHCLGHADAGVTTLTPVVVVTRVDNDDNDNAGDSGTSPLGSPPLKRSLFGFGN